MKDCVPDTPTLRVWTQAEQLAAETGEGGRAGRVWGDSHAKAVEQCNLIPRTAGLESQKVPIHTKKVRSYFLLIEK